MREIEGVSHPKNIRSRRAVTRNGLVKCIITGFRARLYGEKLSFGFVVTIWSLLPGQVLSLRSHSGVGTAPESSMLGVLASSESSISTQHNSRIFYPTVSHIP